MRDPSSRESYENALDHFTTHTHVASIARAVNQKSAGAKSCEAAHDALLNLPDDIDANVMQRALHYRNVLELIGAQQRSSAHKTMREHASAFFKEYRKRGYGFLDGVGE